MDSHPWPDHMRLGTLARLAAEHAAMTDLWASVRFEYRKKKRKARREWLKFEKDCDALVIGSVPDFYPAAKGVG